MKAKMSLAAFLAVIALPLVTALDTIVFEPILDPTVDLSNLTNVVPTSNITLNYWPVTPADNTSLISISLQMKHPAVLLEQIASISNVDCSPSSVSITFNETIAFTTTVAEWSTDTPFVLVTNHLGDCDAEFERGWFLVEGVSSDAGSLSIIATASRGDISTAAEIGEFTFGVLTTTPLSKRFTLSPSTSISASLSLPASTTIFTASPYLTVTADSASISTTLTFSGYLKYSFLHAHLDALYFDLDASLRANVHLSAAIAAAYSKTFTYTPPTLSYSLISIPGILSVGPAVHLGIGAAIDASGAVDLSAGVAIALDDGNVHLDALDSGKITTSGWALTHTASANISAAAKAGIDPFVALTVEMEINLLSGAVDLSTGVTATPGLKNEFVLTATGSTVGGGTAVGAACAEGLQLTSSFVFSVVAFATQWYNKELYHYSTELLNQCFSWVK